MLGAVVGPGSGEWDLVLFGLPSGPYVRNLGLFWGFLALFSLRLVGFLVYGEVPILTYQDAVSAVTCMV